MAGKRKRKKPGIVDKCKGIDPPVRGKYGNLYCEMTQKAHLKAIRRNGLTDMCALRSYALSN
jgi:hypothetical protein